MHIYIQTDIRFYIYKNVLHDFNQFLSKRKWNQLIFKPQCVKVPSSISTVHYFIPYIILVFGIMYNVFNVFGVASPTHFGCQTVSMHILNLRPKKPRMDFVEKSQDENINMLLTFNMWTSTKKKQAAPKRQ